jgi:DNA-binding beta-propeller fold protein YncE
MTDQDLMDLPGFEERLDHLTEAGRARAVLAPAEAIRRRGRRRRRRQVGGGSLLAVALAAVLAAGPLTAPPGEVTSAPGVKVANRALPGITSMTVSDGALWVAHQGGISRVDPATMRVTATLPGYRARTSEPIHLSAGGGSVWALTSGEGLLRIDPGSAKVVAHLAVSRRSAPVAVGAGSVWVACCGPDKGRPVVHELRRIDLASNRVTAKITLPGQPDAVGAGPSGVWVRGSNGPVWRIDPTSNRVAATVQIPGNLGGDRGSVLVGPDDVWVSDPEHRVVYRIDARHDRLTAYRVDLRSPGLQAGLGRTDDGTVWTPATVPPPEEVRTRAERIVVLGLHPGKVVRTLAVPLRYGNDVVTLTAGSQTVWAATDMGELLRFDL